jgi:hypothetical protein
LELKTKKKFEFERSQEFNAFANEHAVTLKLHPARMVFEQWRSTGQLPWAREIPAQQ